MSAGPAAEPSASCRTCTRPVDSPGLDQCMVCLCDGLGITYRQLDYWAKRGYLRPGREARGRYRPTSGSPRVWTEPELRVARLMGRLTSAGLPPAVAEKVARAAPGRCEVAPGIWAAIDDRELQPAATAPGKESAPGN